MSELVPGTESAEGAVTTLTFYRFRGFWARVWAFIHVQLAKAPLQRIPGVRFSKVMGTGAGQGFDLAPDFGVYAILATWDSEDRARTQLAEAPIFRRYDRRATESWTVLLSPTRSRGAWDGRSPFPTAEPDRSTSGPVAVITRATMRGGALRAFWKAVPPVSLATVDEPALLFQVGMGELPVVLLTTFSVWSDAEALHAFAYGPGSAHLAAVKASRKERWFDEELFARFEVVDTWGRWGERTPLAEPRAPAELSA